MSIAPVQYFRMPDARQISTARRLRREMTLAETLLWSRLRHHAIGHAVRRQHPLGPYVADFYCHAARLVIEVDGPIHEAMRARDAARDAWITKHGITVLRFENDQVLTETDGLLEVLAAAITARVAMIGERATQGRGEP